MTTTRVPSETELLLAKLQDGVDRARARREAANALPVKRCGRPRPHRRHTFVTSPASDIDWQCLGHRGTRSLSEIAVDQPWALELGIGGLRHQLRVAAA